MKSKELIAKAKAILILDQPFFASILLTMPISEDNAVKTMATDGDSIRYNSQWVESLSLKEVAFVLAHEVLHCVFQHMTRRGSRNANRWNIAADYVINEALANESFGTMPKGGLRDSNIFAKGGGTAEGIYSILPESTESKGAGQKGGALDEIHDAGSDQGQKQVDQATLNQKAAELRVRVTQAKNAAKMQGKLSAGLERLINDLIKTRTDWREVLRQFISSRAKNDFNFARPKRRFLAEDIHLPSLDGQKIGSIAVAVDCSGSVTDAQLKIFASEINAIFEDCAPSKIEVIYFDSKVLRIQSFNEGESVQLEAIGGGGTDFAPIFKAINELPELPIACVVLTDLECDSFGNAPEYPVLWANYGHESMTAPFGEVIRLEGAK